MHEKIFLAWICFRAVRDIRSLPPYHGARWSAWFRFACKHAGLEADSCFHGLLPLRNGQRPILRGEELTVRLLLDLGACKALPVLFASLAEMEPCGEFSCASLKAYSYKVMALDEVAGIEDVAELCNCEKWQIHFDTPLRLPLPNPHKRRDPGPGMFCQADFFSPANSGQALSHLLGRVRFYPDKEGTKPQIPAGTRIVHSSLIWEDMRYNSQRGIALGGLTGFLECCGQPDRELARRLVWGQYAGAGKNARFGLGYWRIPEIRTASQAASRDPGFLSTFDQGQKVICHEK